LGALYVWHGRGASEDERKVALSYGHSLTHAPTTVIEFEEGKEDEMFWMVLGDDGYANADHWKFKGQLDRLGARIHLIDSSKTKSPVSQAPVYFVLLADKASIGANTLKHIRPRLTR